MKTPKPQLIVALDVDSLAELQELVDGIGDAVQIYKVGSQIFTACGPAAARFLMARGKQVFLDLKFHDIPNTVASSVANAVSLSKAVGRSSLTPGGEEVKMGTLLMYTIHTSGGEEMMKAAALSAAQTAEALKIPRPLTVGVTVLTSQGKDPKAAGLTGGAGSDTILTLVLKRAEAAKRAGLDGVVSSCEEAPVIRKEFGKDFIIVTPGIRPAGADAGDQKRVATPALAVKSGSNFLVVGRPIVQAPDPQQAALKILEEIHKGNS